MKVGFIGLGIMGSRMAANLQKAGHELVVYNRSQDKADELVNNGAIRAQSPEEVAQQCRLVVTMLSTPEAVEEVALGQQGFLKALPGNSLWVNTSTINPSFAKKMADVTLKMGHRYLDAPVAGSLIPAEKGELIFLLGGEESDVNEVQPLLDVMGSKTVHVGGHNAGSAMKMSNNMLMGLTMAAFAEAVKLGTAMGITQEMMFNTLLNGPLAAPFLKGKQSKLANQDYSPEFPLEWMHKDLHLASITAYEQGISMPSLNGGKELYAMAKETGHAQDDYSYIFQFLQAK